MKVGRHLIEQDEDGLVALEELEPVLLVRRLGPAGPERLELVALAELVGDLAPEEMIGVVAAVEGGDVGRLEGVDAWSMPRAVSLAQFGMLGEQAEADEQVGLAAAHRLLEVEDRLGRGPGQPGDALAMRSCMPCVICVFARNAPRRLRRRSVRRAARSGR